MESFNLMVEIKNLMNSFSKLDISNPNEILKWLYLAIDYNSMFEDSTISEYVLMTLRKNGYKDTNDKNNLRKYNELILSKKYSSSEIARYIIGEVMSEINICGYLSTSTLYIIRIFNEKFNKSFTEGYMLDSLNRYAGKNIIYIIYENNSFSIKSGVLNAVSNHSVTIDGVEISLNDIKEIQATDGNRLYNNMFINID